MKVLILGSTGFIGSNFINNLKLSSTEFLCISRSKHKKKNINFKTCDLNNFNYFEKIVKSFEPDICIDFSWHGIPDYSKKNNFLNFYLKKKILKILLKNNCKKVISIGSCWEYGNFIGKVSEKKKSNKSLIHFAKIKKKILDILKIYNKKYKLKFVWVRLFYIYGPMCKKSSLIQSLISNYKKKNNLIIKNKEGSHDYIYVDDACNAIKQLSFKNVKSGVYNLGSGKCVSNQEFLNTFQKIIKKETKKKMFKSKNCLFSDNSKIENAINWRIKFSLHEGIKRTLRYYKIIK